MKCNNLPKMDLLSKSDPFVALYVKNEDTDEFKFHDQTEVIMNNHDPDFSKEFVLDHFDKMPLQLAFKVYDSDDKNGQMKNDKDFIGQYFISTEVLAKRVHNAIIGQLVDIKMTAKRPVCNIVLTSSLMNEVLEEVKQYFL